MYSDNQSLQQTETYRISYVGEIYFVIGNNKRNITKE